MTATYTGAWRNRTLGVTDDTAPLGAADPRRHMTDFSSVLHGIDDTARTRAAVNTPYGLDPPPDLFTDTTDRSAVLATDPIGVPLNLEPGDHSIGDTEWSENNTLRDIVQPSPLHFRDLGSMWARRIRQPRSYQYDEKLTTPRVPANDTISQSDNQRYIGNNFAGARAENNPSDTVQRTPGDPKSSDSARVGWQGAPRVGYRIFRWDTRKIPMHYVRHTSRWLPLRVAKTAQDAPEVPAGNQYVSPFATLANTRVGNQLAPMIRRQPNNWDDTVVTDGSHSAGSEQFQSWGL